MSESQYPFEKTAVPAGKVQRRLPEDANTLASIFVERVASGNSLESLHEGSQKLAKRYAMDVPQNILWYTAATEDEQREMERKGRWVQVIGLVALVVIVGSAFIPLLKVPYGTVIGTQIGVVIAGVFGALQVLAGHVDNRARMAVFWKSRADLKEIMYRFEDKWKGKAVRDKKFTDNFQAALESVLRDARAIGDAEREAFFATYRSPTEMIAAAQTIVGAVQAKAAAAVAGRAAAGAATVPAVTQAIPADSGARPAPAQITTAPAGTADRTSTFPIAIRRGSPHA